MADEPLPPDGLPPPDDPDSTPKPPDDAAKPSGDADEPKAKRKPPNALPMRRMRHKAKRTVLQREQDLFVISRMFLESRNYQDIADAIGVHLVTVYVDVREVVRRWRESGIRDFESSKAIELEKILRMEEEAWKSFFASKTIKKSTTRRLSGKDSSTGAKTGIGGGARDTSRQMVQLTEINGPGDPRFLAIALECGKRRERLLGLTAPQEIAKSEPDTMSKLVASARDMSVEDLEAFQRVKTKFLAVDKT